MKKILLLISVYGLTAMAATEPKACTQAQLNSSNTMMRSINTALQARADASPSLEDLRATRTECDTFLSSWEKDEKGKLVKCKTEIRLKTGKQTLLLPRPEIEASCKQNVTELDVREKAESALRLLDKLESSDYNNRSICIQGEKVIGIKPGAHWSIPGQIAEGTVDNFPLTLRPIKGDLPFGYSTPISPAGWAKLTRIRVEGVVEVYLTSGTVNDKPADFCLIETKPVLE